MNLAQSARSFAGLVALLVIMVHDDEDEAMLRVVISCVDSFQSEMSECSEIKTQPTSGRRHANKDGAPQQERQNNNKRQ